MKKIIILLILSLVCVSAFADIYDDDLFYDSMMVPMWFLLSQDNYYAPDLYGVNYDNPDQLINYMRVRNNPTIPFSYNLLIGLGTGSFLQGDNVGGTIGLLGDLLTLGLMTYATAEDAYNPSEFTNNLLLASCAGFLASRVFQLIRPIFYASEYNKKMQNIVFNTAFVPVNDKLALSLSTTISLG